MKPSTYRSCEWQLISSTFGDPSLDDMCVWDLGEVGLGMGGAMDSLTSTCFPG